LTIRAKSIFQRFTERWEGLNRIKESFYTCVSALKKTTP
jgi:hypothetical protein